MVKKLFLNNKINQGSEDPLYLGGRMKSINYDYDPDYVPVTFSDHGLLRFNERSRMTEEDLNEILRSNKSVPIGTENNRRHELLYSPIDNEYYVIIYDYVVGTVITFIYNHYHDNIAWKISDESLMLAKNLTLESEVIDTEFDESSILYDPKISTLPSALRFKIKIQNINDNDESTWISFPTIAIKQGTSKNAVHNSIFTAEVQKSVLGIIKAKKDTILDSEMIKASTITFTYGKDYLCSIELYDYLTFIE